MNLINEYKTYKPLIFNHEWKISKILVCTYSKLFDCFININL